MLPDTLNVICWLFDGHGITSGGKPVKRDYTVKHVNRFVDQFKDKYPHPCNIWCITDQWDLREEFDCNIIAMPEKLAALPKAFRKLWVFSDEFLYWLPKGSRCFYSDIDVKVVRDPSPLISANGDLVVWQPQDPFKVKSGNYLFTSGTYQWLWDEFSMLAVEDECRPWHMARHGRMTGSDQAWMAYALWERMYPHQWPLPSFGPGIYRAQDIGRELPSDARIVHFPGNVKPWHPKVRERFPWL